MSKKRILELTSEEEAALKYTLRHAQLCMKDDITVNVVLFLQKIDSSPIKEVPVEAPNQLQTDK